MSSTKAAYQFYVRHIFDEEKLDLLGTHGLPVVGSVPSVLWELFGAILTGRTGAGNKGADLNGWEIKSSRRGGSYEYQYHLCSGLEKLREDCIVNHLFFSYSETYKDVTIRALRGSDLTTRYFSTWESKYRSNYDINAPENQRRQRFRKSIPFGYVEKHGKLIMSIVDGDLVETNEEILKDLNTNILK